jgi:hypothetical protein
MLKYIKIIFFIFKKLFFRLAYQNYSKHIKNYFLISKKISPVTYLILEYFFIFIFLLYHQRKKRGIFFHFSDTQRYVGPFYHFNGMKMERRYIFIFYFIFITSKKHDGLQTYENKNKYL